MATNSAEFTVERLYNLYLNGELLIPPGQRRPNAWGKDRKSKLLEFVFHEGAPFSLTPIILKEKKVDQKHTVYEVYDGQQRINTLLSFRALNPSGELNNEPKAPKLPGTRTPHLEPIRVPQNEPTVEYRFPENAYGKSYYELPADLAHQFTTFIIPTTLYGDSYTDEDMGKLFRYTQLGVPLTTGEKFFGDNSFREHPLISVLRDHPVLAGKKDGGVFKNGNTERMSKKMSLLSKLLYVTSHEGFKVNNVFISVPSIQLRNQIQSWVFRKSGGFNDLPRDQAHLSEFNDVFDLIARACEGNRVTPIVDMEFILLFAILRYNKDRPDFEEFMTTIHRNMETDLVPLKIKKTYQMELRREDSLNIASAFRQFRRMLLRDTEPYTAPKT